MINQYIKICDPRHSHLIFKNKWLVLDDLGVKNKNPELLLVEYCFDEKPKFSSEFCKKYLPKIVIRKINKRILTKIFYFLDLDIIENIINHVQDKYVTTVEKRFYRSLNNKWIIDGDRTFYNLDNPINNRHIGWKWYGGDDDGYNIGWIQNLFI